MISETAGLRVGAPCRGRRWCFVLFFLISAALFAGCATMYVVPAEDLNDQQFVKGATPVAHINVNVWGWYLFKYIPLYVGNLDPEGPVLFSDNVALDRIIEELTEKAKSLGATQVTDLRSRDKSGVLIPIVPLIWLNEVEVSGNASK